MDQAEDRVKCQVLLLSMLKLEILPLIGLLVGWLVDLSVCSLVNQLQRRWKGAECNEDLKILTSE